MNLGCCGTTAAGVTGSAWQKEGERERASCPASMWAEACKFCWAACWGGCELLVEAKDLVTEGALDTAGRRTCVEEGASLPSALERLN